MIRRLKNYFHLIESIFANVLYQYPSKDMIVIGVTGTDGKTTTSTFIAHILSRAGYKVALITTVGATINGTFYETGFHTTTPSSFYLQKYLSLAKKEKCTHAVIEVTSHALDQHRTAGIQFKIGVITNVTHEHLDYHKTFDNYLQAKAKLLKKSKIKLLNYDDNSYNLLIKIVSKKNRYFYSLKNKNSYVSPQILPENIQKMGIFNMQNALAAAAVARVLKISEKKITDALLKSALPEGRMEVLHNNSFKVIVDFAHTPNAFQNILPLLKSNTKGKLIHVFGCAGKRDVFKRKTMGAISSKYADIIILTAEDPRGEDVISICKQIASGISKFKQIDSDLMQYEDTKYYVIIPDRKKAIQFALKYVKKGDTVIITGKGHEKSINITGTEESWSDKKVVSETLLTAS